MSKNKILIGGYPMIYNDIRNIINEARTNAIRSVDHCRVQMYWRIGQLLLSNDKETVMAMARGEMKPERPENIIKDPMVLEFLGLERKAHYYESDLESALLSHIQDFLLELGNGFTFVGRQQRITIEDDEYFADMVFYNRLMRCFVVIELKTNKATHADLGQLQMYVNYYDRCVKAEDENPTIGILLCTEKNDTMVKLSLPADNNTILTSKYQLYLPTEQQLKDEVQKVKRLVEMRKEESDPEFANFE